MGAKSYFMHNYTKVSDPDETLRNQSYNPDVSTEANVEILYNETYHFITPREVQTLTYYIAVQESRMVHMEASLVVPTSDDGTVALFHVKDVRFGSTHAHSNKSNVMCTDPNKVSLRSSYRTVFAQTGKIQTMGQVTA